MKKTELHKLISPKEKEDKTVDMQERMNRGKEEANRTLDEKLELAKQCDIDVREIFTDEDFDQLCRRNEAFVGKVANWSNVQRHKKLSLAARWLHCHSAYVVGACIEPIAKDCPNGLVYVDFCKLSELRGEEQRVLTYMCAISDDVLVSGMNDNFNRFSFIIANVWNAVQEGKDMI